MSASDQNYQDLFLAFLDCVLAIIASVTNALLLLTIHFDPDRNLKSPSTYLVRNLAANDLFVGSLAGYVSTVYYALRLRGWPEPELKFVSLFSILLTVVSVTVGSGTIIGMSIDRWLAVTSAHAYRKTVTSKRVKVFGFLLWIYAILFVNLLLAGVPFDVFVLTFCHLHVTLPLIVLPVVYWRTLRALRNHTTRMRDLGFNNGHTNSHDITRERKTTVAFVIILTLFYLAFFPLVAALNVRIFCSVCRDSIAQYVFFQISTRLLVVNCSLNPLVYAWRIPKYRRAVWTVVTRGACLKRRRNAVGAAHAQLETNTMDMSGQLGPRTATTEENGL